MFFLRNEIFVGFLWDVFVLFILVFAFAVAVVVLVIVVLSIANSAPAIVADSVIVMIYRVVLLLRFRYVPVFVAIECCPSTPFLCCR